jgi:hypothetical protein
VIRRPLASAATALGVACSATPPVQAPHDSVTSLVAREQFGTLCSLAREGALTVHERRETEQALLRKVDLRVLLEHVPQAELARVAGTDTGLSALRVRVENRFTPEGWEVAMRWPEIAPATKGRPSPVHPAQLAALFSLPSPGDPARATRETALAELFSITCHDAQNERGPELLGGDTCTYTVPLRTAELSRIDFWVEIAPAAPDGPCRMMVQRTWLSEPRLVDEVLRVIFPRGARRLGDEAG